MRTIGSSFLPVLMVVLMGCGPPSQRPTEPGSSSPTSEAAAEFASPEEVVARCAPVRVADYRGSTGSFDTREEALASAVDESARYQLQAQSEGGQVLFGRDDEAKLHRLVELYRTDGKWAVSAVMECH